MGNLWRVSDNKGFSGSMMGSRKGDRNLSGEWKGFKETWIGCDGKGCNVWQQVRMKEEVKVAKMGEFFCGVCAGVRMEKMEVKLKRLEQEKTELENKMMIETRQQLRQQEEDRKSYKEALIRTQRGMEEGIEKAKREVNEERTTLMKDVRTEVKRSVEEETRKKRVMMFGLKENGKNVEERVDEVLRTLAVASRPCKVNKFKGKESVREGWIAPVMVEFRSEDERNEVLSRKSMLKDYDEMKQVFLEMDLSVQEREEKKKKWILGRIQRKQNLVKEKEDKRTTQTGVEKEIEIFIDRQDKQEEGQTEVKQ